MRRGREATECTASRVRGGSYGLWPFVLYEKESSYWTGGF